MEQLKEHVRAIADDIHKGIIGLPVGSTGPEMLSGFDYLNDALDIQYIVTGQGEYIGARILVAYGGPNIWVNTHTGIVEGYWYGDYATGALLNDPMDSNGACRESWECK